MNKGNCGIYNLNGPWATRKTFLISLFLARVRSQNEVALDLASSGTAARNYTFCLGISTQLLFKYIVWEECMSTQKGSLEALDRMLKYLRDNQNILGGATIQFSGDSRQSSSYYPINFSWWNKHVLKTIISYLPHVKTLWLANDMRVFLQQDKSPDVLSKQSLDIGSVKWQLTSRLDSSHCPFLSVSWPNPKRSSFGVFFCTWWLP